MIRQKIGSTV